MYLESVADETLDRVSARKKLICVDGVDPVSSPVCHCVEISIILLTLWCSVRSF